MFELVVFGGVRVVGPGGPMQGPLAQRRQLALLAFLALQGGRPVSRDRVLAVLWPEADSARARQSLADSVYQIRRSLGAGAIRSIGDDLLLDPDILASDVAAFEAALARGDLAAAVALNRGPLLDGFHLPDSVEFDHWLQVERTRLGRDLLSSLETLATQAGERNDWPQAIDYWHRAAVLEPADSRIAAAYIRALIAGGRRPAAIAFARAHETLLAEEYGDELAPEVRAALEAQPASPWVPVTTVPVPVDAGAVHPEEAAGLAPEAPHPALPANHYPGDGTGEHGAPWSPQQRPNRARRWLPAAMIGVALALLFSIALRLRDPPWLPDRFAVNVCANRSDDPELDFLGSSAAYEVAHRLIHSGIGDVVNYSEVGDFATRASPRALAAEARAATVIDCMFLRRGDSIEFHLEIFDAPGDRSEAVYGPIRAAVSDPGPAIAELARRALGALSARSSLPAGFNPIHDMGYLRSPMVEAHRAYYNGMDRFFDYDMSGAIAEFTRAHDLDPQFLAPLIFMAVAHMNNNSTNQARPLRDKLLEHYDHLTMGEQLQVDWLDASLGGPGQPFQRALLVAERFPRSPFTYQAARNAVGSNRPEQALRLLVSLDSSLHWVPFWPGYWQVLTSAHHLRGEHELEAELIRQMPRDVRKPVRALVYKARAFGAIGATAELFEVLELAATLPTDQASPGDVARVGALELLAHGFVAEADRVFNWALDWYASRPDEEAASLRMDYGGVLYESGRLAEAESHFNSFRSSGASEVNRRGVLAVSAARRGAVAEARAGDQWLEEQGSNATITNWRARIAARLGELDRAVDLLRGNPGTFLDVPHHRDPDYEPLRSHRGFQQLLRRPRGLS